MPSTDSLPPLFDLGGEPHPLRLSLEEARPVLDDAQMAHLRRFLVNVAGYIASLERQAAEQAARIAGLQRRLGLLEDEDGP